MRASWLTIVAALVVWTASGQNPPVPAPAKPARVAPPARIVGFTAQPTTVRAGESVQLTWATENPNAPTISPAVGRVTARGSRQVTPIETTTYTLSIGGPQNAALTSTVTVTVTGASADARSAASTKDPRMPDGKPDFNGVYGFAGVRNAAAPPLKPGAEKFKIVRGPNEVRGNTTLGPDCVPLGIPQTFVTPYPFQIVQTPKTIVMIFEYPNTFRFIPTDGRRHSADPDPTWMGEAVGRWDGDTMVVDTVGFNDKTEVSGYMHTDKFHVVERYRRVENGLEYNVTVDDPNVWTGPWTLPQRILPARPELDHIDEFVCENHTDYNKYFEKK